jgi:hypothetical protein
MKIEVCPISKSKEKVEFLDLGNIPIEGNLCSSREESINIERYPMVLQYFPQSKLVTLAEYINKDKIYLNYLYHSGISKPYISHCSKMYDYLTKYIKFKKGDIVVDIGGNDGSLLLEFKKKNSDLWLINIECSKSFIEINKQNNINYINDYFGENIDLPIKAKLITSTNVFQHTEPLRSFVKGIYKNLSKEGIWCLEFPYLISTLSEDNYDQAYHEHVYYYCLTPLKKLFEQEGLKIINVSFHDIHTGTLRILSVKNDSKKEFNEDVQTYLGFEVGLNKEYCLEWGKNILKKINEFKEFFTEKISEGKIIYGFGAAIKGCVFLNTCKLDYNTIKYIIDDTLEKQGKFVPGTGIEVVSRNILKTNPPDYILILAHNFKDYIIESLKKEYKGKFIVMFPNIAIL